MIRLENVRVYNIDSAILGARNSWESWSKSDSVVSWQEDVKGTTHESNRHDIYMFPSVVIGKNDMNLLKKLAKAGSDHAKYRRQILVSMDIIAPEYFWREFDTYKVGTTANSTSQMHTAGKRPFELGDFSFDEHSYFENIVVEQLNDLRAIWIREGKKKPSEEWRRMLQAIPQSFNYRRTWTGNYEVLKNMYHSRKNHRLQEWQDFCEMIEEFPYSELFTLKD